MLKNNELGFTLTIYDGSQAGCCKIELPNQLVIKICKDMRILKQMWFNFKGKETDIIKRKNRTLTLDQCYNIKHKDFLSLINAVKRDYNLSDLTMCDIKALRNLLNILGGNLKLEKKLDEIQAKQKYDLDRSKEERYFKTTIKPELDYQDKFIWRQVIWRPTTAFFEEIKTCNKEGYVLISLSNNIYCFRKRK